MENKSEEDIVFKTQSAAAAFFEVNRRTFADWLASGCPGKPGRYSLREICHWMISLRRCSRW